jgi:hypothetical protein
MLGNLLALATSAALVVALLELWLFPAFLYRLPLALHERIVSPAVRTLAQSSKAGTIPRDYVALVGDSYAAGEGDWRLTVDAGGNPPHTSAHLLHAETGRDVVTFGHAGAGSLRGLVSEPIGRLAYLARTLRFRVEDPADILVYFYEGNDLDDNLEDLRLRFDPHWDRARLRDPAYFHRFLDETVLGQSDLMRDAEGFRPLHNLFVLRSLRWNLTRLATEGELPRAAPRPMQARPARQVAPGKEAGLRPELIVAGERLRAPTPLQAPAPELHEDELGDALYVFDQSLARLGERFTASRIRVLYLPSALLCYQVPERPVRVQEDHHRPDRPDVFEPAFLRARSDRICREVAAAARRLGMPFRDARPGLRAAGRDAILHGPRDWRHLNRAGQGLMADEAAALLAQDGDGRCARLADEVGPELP